MDYQQAIIRLKTPIKYPPKAQTGREVGWMVVCKIALFPKKASSDSLSSYSLPRWPCAYYTHIHEKFLLNNEQ